MLFCFVLIPRTTSLTSHVLIKYIIACNCTLAAEPGPGSVSRKVCEESWVAVGPSVGLKVRRVMLLHKVWLGVRSVSVEFCVTLML